MNTLKAFLPTLQRVIPNPMPWHPAIVHFPIALLVVAVTVDVVALFMRRASWHPVAWRLLVGGTLSALIAVVTGDAAAADYRQGDETAAIVQHHEDMATLCLLLFGVASLGRLPIALGRPPRWLAYWIALSFVGVGLIVFTSVIGGELVYVHGVGVIPTP